MEPRSGPRRLSPADALALVGAQLGPSRWRAVDRRAVAAYVAAVGGDPDTTDAPAALVASLAPVLLRDVLVIDAGMAINYGADRVRHHRPVAVGERVRANVEIKHAEEAGGALRVTYRITIEADGADGPSCVVDHISRYSD